MSSFTRHATWLLLASLSLVAQGCASPPDAPSWVVEFEADTFVPTVIPDPDVTITPDTPVVPDTKPETDATTEPDTVID